MDILSCTANLSWSWCLFQGMAEQKLPAQSEQLFGEV